MSAGDLPGCQRVTFPALMQDVHTCSRLGVPSTVARTTWMLGFQRRGVRRCEWETLLPKPGLLPQMSQTAATGSLRLVWLRKLDAAPAPPGPAVEGYPTPAPRRELGRGAPACRGRPHRPAAYPLSPWRAWTNRCAAWWGGRPQPGRRRRSACARPATCCGTTRAATPAAAS